MMYCETDLNTDRFEFLMNKIHSVNYVKINHENWKLSICSCSWWKNHYICPHVIDLSVTMVKYPEQAMTVPLDQKENQENQLQIHLH